MSSSVDERPDQPDEHAAAFERRVRRLLLDSVEGLPASTRSRLTRARYAALSSQPSWPRQLSRRWLPAGAGALAAAAVAVMFVVIPHGESPNPLANAAPEDIELLADSDAVQLGRDEDVDYEFYEWAVGEATDTSAPSVGS